MDHLLPQLEQASAEGREKDTARIAALADFQKRAVLHALAFPDLRRLVYSTCSVLLSPPPPPSIFAHFPGVFILCWHLRQGPRWVASLKCWDTPPTPFSGRCQWPGSLWSTPKFCLEMYYLAAGGQKSLLNLHSEARE